MAESYDVLFVSRKAGVPSAEDAIARDVDKETAIRLASAYCHRNEADEGVAARQSWR